MGNGAFHMNRSVAITPTNADIDERAALLETMAELNAARRAVRAVVADLDRVRLERIAGLTRPAYSEPTELTKLRVALALVERAADKVRLRLWRPAPLIAAGQA